jgi:hypothetical protein
VAFATSGDSPTNTVTSADFTAVRSKSERPKIADAEICVGG